MVATPTFRRDAAGTCVMPYLFYPLKQGETLPVRAVAVKKDGTIEILYRNGDKDRICYRIGDKCLESLSVTTRQGGQRETLPIL